MTEKTSEETAILRRAVGWRPGMTPEWAERLVIAAREFIERVRGYSEALGLGNALLVNKVAFAVEGDYLVIMMEGAKLRLLLPDGLSGKRAVHNDGDAT